MKNSEMQAVGHRDAGRDLKEDTLKETQTWGIDGCGETHFLGWTDRMVGECPEGGLETGRAHTDLRLAGSRQW